MAVVKPHQITTDANGARSKSQYGATIGGRCLAKEIASE